MSKKSRKARTEPPQVLEPGCAFTKTGDAYYVGNEDFFDGYWQEEEEK